VKDQPPHEISHTMAHEYVCQLIAMTTHVAFDPS
jgi:hypothetical protein